MMTSRLGSFVRFYNKNFDRRPIPTLMITNATLNTLADVLVSQVNHQDQDQDQEEEDSANNQAQTSTIYFSPADQRPAYDPERTLRFGIFGLAMGPLIGRWLRLLERHIPMVKAAAGASGAGTTSTGIQLAKRVLADQVVMAPIGLTLFVGSMGLMEGKSSTELSEKFQNMFWPAMLANWKVWPVIQAVNFSIIPFQYRLPFQSTCSIGWTLFLSILNAEEHKPPPSETSEVAF